jgi:hypothetical protein
MAWGEIYVKLVVGFPRDPKVRALVRYGAEAGLARDLYVQMCLYCKENLSDGLVPAEEVGVLVYPLAPDHGERLAKQLASVGLIKEVSNGEAQACDVLAFLKRNGSREDVERLSAMRAEAGRAGGTKSRKRPGHRPRQATGKQSAKQKISNADPYTETETETGSKPITPAAAPPPRGDVERLCAHLAGRIEANGANRPTVTQRWRDAARLLLDKDGRTEQQVQAAIDWCQDSEFWRSNILSMPTLREKYEQLRLQAQRANGNGAASSTGAERAHAAHEAGRRVQAMLEGDPR